MRCRQFINAWGKLYGTISEWPDDDATWQRIAAGVLEPCEDDFTWLDTIDFSPKVEVEESIVGQVGDG